MRNLTIETELTYDYDDNFRFTENFEILRYSGYRETSISLYLDYGNLSNDYDMEQDCIIEDSRENRVKIKRHLTQQGWQRVSELFGNLDELCEDIGGVDYSNIEELYEVLDDIGIEYKSNYLRTATRGYSQGDCAAILINVAEFKEKMGTEFDLDGMQKWFDHYFWDSPIHGEIEVHFEYTKNAVNYEYDETFDFNEFTLDEYDIDELDIDVMVNWIKNKVVHPLNEDELKEIKTALEKLDYTDIKSPRCGC